MNLTRAEIITAIGAVLAFVLQIVVAPNIAIGLVFPNIALVYVCLVGILRPRQSWPILPFFLGLSLDLIPGSFVGLNALVFVLTWFLASHAFKIFDNDTIFITIAILAVALLGADVLYGLLLSGFAIDANMGAVLWDRSIPSAIYEFVLGLLLYLPLSRLLREEGSTTQSHISQFR